ncbi:MAG: DUF4886 domain-containing protein [Clostridia bacterium]|nr:DUF4886 domain-containing protein [Clostridia bacterium]
MINVLAIGNSFSQDATRYLRKVAQAAGDDIKVVNLYIGGCPLWRHYKNICEDAPAYSLEIDGESTGFFVSIRQALLTREWDFVTMQQVSNQSPDYDTYQPYLDALSDYVLTYSPKAKQVIHQTWAYENGSARLCEELGYQADAEMFEKVRQSYAQAADDISADLIIPSGEAMLLAANQGFSMHRDTFHASYGIGRYLLAATWYEALTGKSTIGTPLFPLDIFADENELITMQEIAHSTVASYK